MIQQDRLLRHIERLGEHPRTPGPRLMRWESRDLEPVVCQVHALVEPWQQQADEYWAERVGEPVVSGLAQAWGINRKALAARTVAVAMLAAD